MILIRRENKGNLVDIIPVQLFSWQVNEAVDKGICVCLCLLSSCPLTLGILHHCSWSLFNHVIIAVHAGIGFQIETKMFLITPVNDVFHVFYRQSLMHNNFTMIFHICTIASDHAIQLTQLPLFNFCFGAACTDIDKMAIGTCLIYCPTSRSRHLCFIVNQCSIDIQKNDFLITHVIILP